MKEEGEHDAQERIMTSPAREQRSWVPQNLLLLLVLGGFGGGLTGAKPFLHPLLL